MRGLIERGLRYAGIFKQQRVVRILFYIITIEIRIANLKCFFLIYRKIVASFICTKFEEFEKKHFFSYVCKNLFLKNL